MKKQAFVIYTLIITSLYSCVTFKSNKYTLGGTLMYKRVDSLKLNPDEQKRVLWDNGKLCYVATGLPKGFIKWQLYARSTPEDSILMVTKNDRLYGLYSEHSKNKQVVGFFKNNKRDGVFLLKINKKIILYELWENGTLVQTLDSLFLPEEDMPILTFYNKW